jgi:hypothetical protein
VKLRVAVVSRKRRGKEVMCLMSDDLAIGVVAGMHEGGRGAQQGTQG